MKALHEFCERFGLVEPFLTTQATRLHLARLFAALGFTKGAEIGTWAGEYAARLCETVPGLHLTCVDPWMVYSEYRDPKNDPDRMERTYLGAKERLSRFNCTILRMTSVEGARRVPDGSLDFVYIDGNHAAKFVTQDLRAWVPKVRSGGIVAGHDYALKDHLEVKPAVDAYVKAHQIAPLYVLAGDKSPSYFWMVP